MPCMLRVLLCLVLVLGLAQANPVAIFNLTITNPGVANQTTEIDIQDVAGSVACANFPQPDTVCTDLFLRSGTLNVTFEDLTTGTSTLSASLPISGDLNPVPEFSFPTSPSIISLTFTGTFSTSSVAQDTTLTLFDGSTFIASPDLTASLDFLATPGCSPGNCNVIVFANEATAVPEPGPLPLSVVGLLLLAIPITRKTRQLNLKRD